MTLDRPTEDVDPPQVDAGAARAPAPGRWWALGGFLLGIVASVAANIAYSYVPPWLRDTDPSNDVGPPGSDWSPPGGLVVLAAFIPVALIVSVEVISRVNWSSSVWWKLLRLGGASLVAAVAAVISYRHLYGLIRSYGEDQLTATIAPLAIDGLMLVCSAALLSIARRGRTPERAPAADVEEPEPSGLRPGDENPPPRVRSMVDQLLAGVAAGVPLPTSADEVNRALGKSNKGDAGQALRIARFEAPSTDQAQTSNGRFGRRKG